LRAVDEHESASGTSKSIPSYFELTSFPPPLEGKANIHSGDDCSTSRCSTFSSTRPAFSTRTARAGSPDRNHLPLGRPLILRPCSDHAVQLPDVLVEPSARFSSPSNAEFTGSNHYFSLKSIIACHLRTLVWLVRRTSRSPSRRAKRRSRAGLNDPTRTTSPTSRRVLAKMCCDPLLLFRLFRKKKGVTAHGA